MRFLRLLVANTLVIALVGSMAVLAPLAAEGQAVPIVIINEFLASNSSTAPDATGEYEDWIELHNTSSATVNLAGWTIAGGADIFAFSAATSIDAGGFLVVFASGEPSRSTTDEVHLSFKLDADGESLVLTDPGGTVSTPAWPAPGYPAQPPDVSYGVDPDGVQAYFSPATPGAVNTDGASGIVEAVTFSVPHGFYSTTQNVTLDTVTPGATIRYTLDGSTPSATEGTVVAPGSSLAVSSTTNLRTIAYRSGWIASQVETRTYLFVSDITSQSQSTPAGWPDHLAVNGHHLYYGMDPAAVASQQAVTDALLAVPSISITTDLTNLFDPADGIYVNPLERGREWERPASVELIDPTGAEPGFDINAGLRLRGNGSRDEDNPKHSFRFFFRSEYGESELNYPLFGSEGVDRFEKVDLRTDQSWSWQKATAADPGRGEASTWLRDVWTRDTQLAMGQPSTRSRSYHLYVNGQYWGIYESEERASAEHGEDYFGGNAEDYDVIKRLTDFRTSQATDGTYDAWAQLWPLVSDLQVTDAEYVTLDSLVDLENLADHYLLHFFGGDGDGAPRRNLTVPNNWLALRNRTGVGAAGKWIFYDRDSESALCQNIPDERLPITPDIDVTTPWDLRVEDEADPEYSMHPGYLHEALITHPGYVQIFRDSVQQHMLTPGGALTTPQMVSRFDTRRDVVGSIIDAEAARWGGVVRTPAFSTADWTLAVATLRDCFDYRTGVTEQQLSEDGLWPLSNPAVISPAGGPTPFGTSVTVDAAGQQGTLYVTIDGTDPLTSTGTVAATAFVYSSPLVVTTNVQVKARINDGDSWSPLVDETYVLSTTGAAAPILLNEYNAVSSSRYLGDGGPGDIANGTDTTLGRVLGNGGDWVELVVVQNQLDLRGYTIVISNLVDAAREVSASLTFADSDELSSLRSGTLLTISEDFADDMSYHPPAGDWHINLQANDQLAGSHFTAASQSNFVVNNDDTQVTILAPDGTIVALTTGEGTAPGASVNSQEVFKLEVVPTGTIGPTDAGYADGTSSSFGEPNTWADGASEQDLTGLRIAFGDVNCTNTLSIADALFIAQFVVGNRQAAQSCPLSGLYMIYEPAADVNNDGRASVLDALLVAQCTVGNPNIFCPE